MRQIIASFIVFADALTPDLESTLRAWRNSGVAEISEVFLLGLSADVLTTALAGQPQVHRFDGKWRIDDCITQTTSDFLIFIDGICKIDEAGFERRVALRESAAAAIYFGSVTTQNQRDRGLNDLASIGHDYFWRIGTPMLGAWATLPVANFAMVKSLAKRVDFQKSGYHSEAIEWLDICLRAVTKGMTLIHYPKFNCFGTLQSNSNELTKDCARFHELHSGPDAACFSILSRLVVSSAQFEPSKALEALKRFEAAYRCSAKRDITLQDLSFITLDLY